jgi:multidrug resistance efflux pump
MLVPPPPPTMPTYLNATSPIAGSFDLGLSVNFMSLEDLKFQQKTLQTKLEAAKLDEQDEARSNNEKKDRAQRFVELYKEGVVSRRELETAQQESERAIRDSGQSHIKVSEIDRVLTQVKERISSMEAAKRPAKVSSKKSKTR